MRSAAAGLALILTLLARVFPAAEALAQPDAGFARPPAGVRCPVCGMFVEPYQEWWTQVVFADGRRESFDGVKDLVRYLGDRGRYTPGRAGTPIVGIWVTDYYQVEPIPAEKAFYVVGSDVAGPMGREFIPLATREQAGEFLRDHRGAAILEFRELPGRQPD